MAKDKYSAVWVSHSSMGDFLKCPRLYYLHNIYKDPRTGRKITLVSSAMSLGQVVHNTIEALKEIPLENRFTGDLVADFEKNWQMVSGQKGGFHSDIEEQEAKKRGLAMIERVIKNPGPIARKTIRLKPTQNNMPPNFYLSEEDNIILCGLIDWIEYIEADDSVKVIDFKTGKNEEDEDSLQLPIYLLLLEALQKRKVSGAAYWYLDKNDELQDKQLPDPKDAYQRVLTVAKKVKEAREKNNFSCPKGEAGCFGCKPYEAILRGEATYLGVGGYGQDIYMI